MIITKKFMPRRTFLRGMGATMALPLLEAMVPAATPLAKTAAAMEEQMKDWRQLMNEVVRGSAGKGKKKQP